MKKLTTKNIYLLTGHLGFLVMMFLSVFFYRERVLFLDTVFQFFKIVNFEKFNIEAARYGTFITQLPLLLALKLHASLKTLVLIYSVSFILIYYIVFIICTHLLKNPAAGVAVLFSLVICIAQSFYHPSTETHQAIVYSVLLYAILQYNFNRWVKYILSGFIVLLSFYCHPVAFFTVLFVIFLKKFEQKDWKKTGEYILLALILLLTFLKLYFTKGDSYEGNFFNELFGTDISIRNVLNIYSLHFFITRMDELYFWMCLLLVIAIVIFYMKKEHLIAIYVAVASGVLLIITLITYAKGDADIMMERSFMPLAVYMVLPFFIAVQKIEKHLHKIILFILVLVIFTLSIRRITDEGNKNRDRLIYVEGLIDGTKEYNSNKFLLQKTPENNEKILYTWPFAFTTLVISSMDGPQYSRTIYLCEKTEDYLKYTTKENNIFLGANFWLEWKSNELNRKYFILPDGPYAILK